MIRSMTGFGRAEASTAGPHVVVEMRSVNHRFREIVIRLSREMLSLEDRIRRMVQEKIARGRVEVSVALNGGGPRKRRLKVDRELAIAYHRALKELQAELGTDGCWGTEAVAQFPAVFTVVEEEEDPADLWPSLEQAVGRALADLVAMRENEGQALAADFTSRLERVARLVEDMKVRAPLAAEEHRRRLAGRLAEFLTAGTLDEGRLAVEVAMLVERGDVSEEIVRIGSHLAQLRQVLAEGGPVGRRLEFILQEINREVNTIGAKAGDAVISQDVVAVKCELEKLREQAQNLE